ncbi:Tyrosine-protein kinase YwqD [Maioricimonas rarisocia]|uniref:non-specific protein-tyrosine kinase n=1 Tax=Maioricimonas rarisocia TaxID=2528026 RepID=A0A517ZCB5_9PLAN|nr:polysaccharide biosynthesis tyrosine autokinase [Maioricimonas rarisocia]QDU40080.1 Tyrosine-protein kinase YwqD [Maioricimonas rarisocia]
MNKLVLEGAGDATGRGESLDFVRGVVRFGRVVRNRLHIVLGILVSVSILGGISYVLSPPVYESAAELLVLQTGSSVLDSERNPQGTLSDQMPNFERVLRSDEVVKRTLKQLPPEHRSDFRGVRPERWIESFQSHLEVSAERKTNVMNIRYRSGDADTAYVVVSTLIGAYLEYMDHVMENTARDLLGILSQRKDALERDLKAREAELIEMKSRSQLLFASDEDRMISVLNQRVIKLNESLVKAQHEAIDARSFLLAIEEAIRQGEDIQQFASRMSEGLATELLKRHAGIASGDVYTQSRMQQELLSAQTELRNKLSFYGPKHPEILELQDKIRITQQYLTDQPRMTSESVKRASTEDLGPRLLQMARHRYLMAANQEQQLLAEFERERDNALQLNQQLAEIQIAELEIQRMRTYDDVLLDAITNIDLNKDNHLRTAVISEPQVNPVPVSPRLTVVAMLCLIIGTGGGLATVYLMDIIDDRFRSPDQLRSELGLPILAMIRKLPPLADSGLSSLYPFSKPNAVESEAFRSLRTTLEFSNEDTKCMTISSTEPGDGKTTVMASLGVAFAQSGRRTILIDGDMRRPGLTRLFNLTGHPGLSTVLMSDRSVEEAIDTLPHHTELPNLDVLPAGPRPANPVELLSGDRLSMLVAWAETHYDQVLIDAPPSLAAADGQIIGRMVDGAIMTVRPDKNRRRMVMRAVEALSELGCNVYGLIVNHVSPQSDSEYSYGYGYGYGYGEHDNDADEDAQTLPAGPKFVSPEQLRKSA